MRIRQLMMNLAMATIGLVWAVTVFAINAVYFPLVEEPDLRRRFGSAYDEYAARTPRWLPR